MVGHCITWSTIRRNTEEKYKLLIKLIRIHHLDLFISDSGDFKETYPMTGLRIQQFSDLIENF